MASSGKSALKSIVHSIAFAGVAALAQGLEVAEVVAAAEVEGDDMVYCESLLGAAALALIGVAIENVFANWFWEFATWGFVGLH